MTNEEKKFIITDAQKENILYFLNVHSTLSIKDLLKQLPLLELYKEYSVAEIISIIEKGDLTMAQASDLLNYLKGNIELETFRK